MKDDFRDFVDDVTFEVPKKKKLKNYPQGLTDHSLLEVPDKKMKLMK